MQKWCRLFLWACSVLFLFSYPFAVIGVAFDVRPPFSLSWAGSFLLFLEGALLIVAAMYLYDWSRALVAAVGVIVLSYLVETLGVHSGFPFGQYVYTGVLIPQLPGSVPLAVMFAWVLIVFGAYGIVRYAENRHGRANEMKESIERTLRPFSITTALLGALLAALLDLAIEPVAFHVVQYWLWLRPGRPAYYGVPPVNFVAWFVTAFVFILFVDFLLHKWDAHTLKGFPGAAVKELYAAPILAATNRVAMLAPCILFLCSLFMFGLVDLTHGYYWGSLWALLGAISSILLLRWGQH